MFHVEVFGLDNVDSSNLSAHHLYPWVERKFIDLLANFSYLTSAMIDIDNRNKNSSVTDYIIWLSETWYS